tara:strand:- start:29615 stop:30352 length:738 start_codon:yes stop_codon:yes gene_type:complete
VVLFDLDDRYLLETPHDFQNHDFVFYDEAVEHYSLKNITKKVGSFEELTYYAEVFLYLNPDVEYPIYVGYFQWLGSRDSGCCVRTYTKTRINHYLRQIYFTRKKPYCRRMRKIIFNPEKIISPEQKMSISAQLLKRGCVYNEQDVVYAVDTLYRNLDIATAKSIAQNMYCSTSTVNRLINSKIRNTMSKNNEEVREQLKLRVLLDTIDLLTSSGDSVKIRALKEMTSIRDYKLIKKAMTLYLRDK